MSRHGNPKESFSLADSPIDDKEPSCWAGPLWSLAELHGRIGTWNKTLAANEGISYLSQWPRPNYLVSSALLDLSLAKTLKLLFLAVPKKTAGQGLNTPS